jgi:hypothetical protein
MQARLFYRFLRLALPSSFWGDTNQGTQVLAYLMTLDRLLGQS